MQQSKSGKFFVGSLITFAVVFAVIKLLLMLALSAGKGTLPEADMSVAAVAERIAPVATATVGVAPAVVAAVAAPAASAGSDDLGAGIIKQTCALCHSTGMMMSPKLGSADEWAPRIEKGMDVLYASAIDGFNMMPARGGNPGLTDAEVKAAVDTMVRNAGGTVAATDTEAAAVAAPAETEAAPVVETAAVAAPAETETAPVVETASVDTSELGAGIIKQSCALCHSTGMMMSPKLGSADDWAPRIEKGMDVLYASAIDGFNMMPARGGNPGLTDAEVKAAVDVMVQNAL